MNSAVWRGVKGSAYIAGTVACVATAEKVIEILAVQCHYSFCSYQSEHYKSLKDRSLGVIFVSNEDCPFWASFFSYDAFWIRARGMTPLIFQIDSPREICSILENLTQNNNKVRYLELFAHGDPNSMRYVGTQLNAHPRIYNWTLQKFPFLQQWVPKSDLVTNVVQKVVVLNR